MLAQTRQRAQAAHREFQLAQREISVIDALVLDAYGYSTDVEAEFVLEAGELRIDIAEVETPPDA